MNLTKCILFVFFITNITSCTVTSYETLKATSGGFSYEYVTDDPTKTRIYTLENGLKVYLSKFENAQKYSPKGSEIIWKSHENHGKIAFSITDQGPGIPVKERKKVFDMFYRLDSEETRTSKGTGLGLYLVDNIIKLHKGEISVTNYGEGCELMIKI